MFKQLCTLLLTLNLIIIHIYLKFYLLTMGQRCNRRLHVVVSQSINAKKSPSPTVRTIELVRRPSRLTAPSPNIILASTARLLFRCPGLRNFLRLPILLLKWFLCLLTFCLRLMLLNIKYLWAKIKTIEVIKWIVSVIKIVIHHPFTGDPVFGTLKRNSW